MKKIILFPFLFLLIQAKAQQLTDKQYKEEYRKAVQLFANNQFEEAIQRFLPLTKSTYIHAMAPYAHYYLALSANNITNFTQAKLTLHQLLERFPNWKYYNEVYYLLAEANFGEQNYVEALDYLSQITSKSMAKDIDNMTFKYIDEIKTISQLKTIYEKFPANKTVATVLIEKIQAKQNPTKEELRLSDLLTNRFGIEKKSVQVYDNNPTISIGALLPFNLKQGVISASNQYVYDLYIGMKMAEKKANSEGIPLQILAFDIEKDPYEFQQLTSNPNLQSVDLFIGPLFSQTNEEVLNYANKNKIFQVHPFSNNSSLIENEKNVFLIQPTYLDQAERALEDIQIKTTKKTVSIYFGKSKKDSLFAFRYAQLARNKGFNVLEIKHLYPNSLVNSSNNNGHIFVTCEPDEAGNILRGIRKQKQSCPIYISGSSFNSEKISKDILANNVFILYPEFVDNEKSEIEYFKSKYINDYGTLPSYYSYLGYDMAYFWAKMLKEGRGQLRNNLNLIEYTQDYLLSGFDYTSNSNSNRIIPIVTVQDGVFREIGR